MNNLKTIPESTSLRTLVLTTVNSAGSTCLSPSKVQNCFVASLGAVLCNRNIYMKNNSQKQGLNRGGPVGGRRWGQSCTIAAATKTAFVLTKHQLELFTALRSDPQT